MFRCIVEICTLPKKVSLLTAYNAVLMNENSLSSFLKKREENETGKRLAQLAFYEEG